MPARKININDVDYQVLTGAELIRTAIDDWLNFTDNDVTLIQWYPKLDVVLPNKKYVVSPMLDFEEVEDGTRNL
ncbi:hypothetical protein FC84_GL001667 [Lapidilactobacillus dextrinicus DSM 20335]|uniref:Uncharacterized protein n=1 Tax=Lapidilactobacillus dextrinicus DSM 20335 TaxID=1423738 RepID=A0A0R2BIZ4_9LACO|nr:hypothetical protein [Lapidilactobacillus dextrinicus]KRM79487.1 hypothetical protein FC84_GL001667 [Lapidilactobacillus dextrinicus DSM 20335]QFG46679.1 hypothetical protein LH506_04120 [Lapidilactobacillus dextrinicus]